MNILNMLFTGLFTVEMVLKLIAFKPKVGAVDHSFSIPLWYPKGGQEEMKMNKRPINIPTTSPIFHSDDGYKQVLSGLESQSVLGGVFCS